MFPSGTIRRPQTLRCLAAALEVSVDVLLGHVAANYPTDIHVTPLRRAITASEHIPGLTDFSGAHETVTACELTRSAPGMARIRGWAPRRTAALAGENLLSPSANPAIPALPTGMFEAEWSS